MRLFSVGAPHKWYINIATYIVRVYTSNVKRERQQPSTLRNEEMRLSRSWANKCENWSLVLRCCPGSVTLPTVNKHRRLFSFFLRIIPPFRKSLLRNDGSSRSYAPRVHTVNSLRAYLNSVIAFVAHIYSGDTLRLSCDALYLSRYLQFYSSNERKRVAEICIYVWNIICTKDR